MTALLSRHLDEFYDRGFVVVPEAFGPALALELREALAKLAHDQRSCVTERTKIDDFMVHNPMLYDQRFLDVLQNPTVVSVLDAILGDTSLLYAYTTSSMPAHGTNYSRRIHVDCPRIIPGYVTNIGIIVALDDFTADNGASYFLPGSFDRANAPEEDEFFGNSERVFPRRGDLVVFNARTWHTGGVNTTGDERHAVTINGCRSYMRQRFDYPRLVDQSIVDKLTPTLRRILGFNVRVPASMQEYYLPEDQRLYKANQG